MVLDTNFVTELPLEIEIDYSDFEGSYMNPRPQRVKSTFISTLNYLMKMVEFGPNRFGYCFLFSEK